MLRQVEGRSVSVASYLDPAIGCLNLGIPAVISVVGHLVGSVLSEADCLWFYTNLGQEEVTPGEEVSKGLILNYFMC